MRTTGFPSPAQGYEQKSLDFNSILVKHPAATFAMRYTGPGLSEEHILQDDILIVDCAALPGRGKLAVLSVDGEFRCVRLSGNGSVKEPFSYTAPDGSAYTVTELFGIVQAVVRML